MDFGWTSEQKGYRDSVVAFARPELNDDLVRRDALHEFPHDSWKKCAAFGLQGLPVPQEYGGSGSDPLTIAIALEALGYGCRDNGLIFALNAHLWSCVIPVLVFGTEDQKRRYLPGLCDGSLVGVGGMTEPEAGSDAFSLTTSAERRGDGYVLNGTKTFITNAPIADVIVVFASTDRSKGFSAISAFLVERGTSGLTVEPPFQKMGLRTATMSKVVLSDCEVPAESRLGKPGVGAAVFNTSMEWERSFILASAVGTMQRQLEQCVAHARKRRQFGVSISKFQAVSHKIVGMKLRLKTARLLLYELAWLRSQRKSNPGDAALVKLHLSECLLESSLDALYIHGAYGYMVENEFEREVRDAIASQIYSGTSDIQRNVVAGFMRL
jgi:alkylation response protein AidB-like acyl-CoA dehydrogenase